MEEHQKLMIPKCGKNINEEQMWKNIKEKENTSLHNLIKFLKNIWLFLM